MFKLIIRDRLRLDKASYRKDSFSYDKNIPKKFLKYHKGYKIFVVDGNYIRNNIDIDFVGGGNPARYQYVPDGELWIEKLSNNEESDIEGFIEHEYTECERMINKGETYSQAHDKASKVEKKIRSKYR